MKFNVNIFGLSAAVTATICHILVGLVLKFLPAFAMRYAEFSHYLVNVERYAVDVKFTWQAFMLGSIVTFIGVYIFAAIFAAIYNAITRSMHSR